MSDPSPYQFGFPWPPRPLSPANRKRYRPTMAEQRAKASRDRSRIVRAMGWDDGDERETDR